MKNMVQGVRFQQLHQSLQAQSANEYAIGIYIYTFGLYTVIIMQYI